MIVIIYPLLILVIFILGVVTGGFSNVTSGGAGILTIYILTNYGPMAIQKSTGTVLAASTIIVLIGAISFYRRKQVDTQLAITVGLSGVAGAFLAARWASSVQSQTVEQAFGAFTLALAFYTAIRFTREWRRTKYATKPDAFTLPTISGGSDNNVPPTPTPINAQTARTGSRLAGTDPLALSVQIAKGVLIGVATGLFGVGLASLSIVLFMLLFKLDTKMILGTSLFASFFRYVGGSAGYLTAGQVDPLFFAVIAVGGSIGSLVGARIVLGKGKSKGSKDVYIKMIVVGILLFISYEFLLKYYLPFHLHI